MTALAYDVCWCACTHAAAAVSVELLAAFMCVLVSYGKPIGSSIYVFNWLLISFLLKYQWSGMLFKLSDCVDNARNFWKQNSIYFE